MHLEIPPSGGRSEFEGRGAGAEALISLDRFTRTDNRGELVKQLLHGSMADGE